MSIAENQALLNADQGPSPASVAPPLVLAELSERCMGNTAIATLLLVKFEAQLRSDLLVIEQRAAAGDAAEVGRTAHALKGAAGAVAASALRTLAGEVESQARQEHLDAVTGTLSALRAEVERCLAYLPAAREKLNGTSTIPQST